MKTVTEFTGITIKNSLQKRQELTTAGKTAEELPAALGEALKLEGDKLTRLISAMETVGTKTNDLKRVLVLSLAENEKPPAAALQKGELYYLVEFYPSFEKPQAKPQQGERGGKRGKGGRDRNDRGDRGGRGPGGDKRDSRPPKKIEGATKPTT